MVIQVTYTDFIANLTHQNFEGYYNGVERHDMDLGHVLERAWKHRFEKIIIPGDDLKATRRALDIAKSHEKVYCGIGVQPNAIQAFKERQGPEMYLPEFKGMLAEAPDKVVAIGRVGFDLTKEAEELCPTHVQGNYLIKHLDLSLELNLPVILFYRNGLEQLFNVLEDYRGSRLRGVISSFSGSLETAQKFIDLGINIGITACSLQTDQTYHAIKNLPLANILIGSDSPGCNIKPSLLGYQFMKTEFQKTNKLFWSHHNMVKGRNEPIGVIPLVEMLAGARGIKPEFMAVLNTMNTKKLFFPLEPPVNHVKCLT